MQLFFDIDVLKLTPSNLYLYTNGKLRHGNIDPYLPSSMARDPTLADLFGAADPMPYVNANDEVIDKSKNYITLRDIQYTNNVMELFSNFKYSLTQLIESVAASYDGESGSDAKKTESKYRGLIKSRLPKELNALPPKLQIIEAIFVLIFFFALIFDFEEIIGPSIPPDLKIKLTDEELEQIDKEEKKLGEEAEIAEK